MNTEEHNKALNEMYDQGQNVFNKYFDKAEYLQSHGHHKTEDTLDLAVKIYMSEKSE